jgi:hypothetical protein
MRAPEGSRVAIALPMLRLVYCWTQSTAALYIPELRRRLGTTIAVRDAIYSATEGWCSITMGDEAPGGPLALHSGFYELIPEAAYASGDRTPTPLEEVRDGERFVIVMTTASGMYRCDLGDVVEVCGKYRRTPRIFFSKRRAASSNLIGEKIDEVHVTRAVGVALAAAKLEATWFTLVAHPADPPHYTLHLELPATTTLEDRAGAALVNAVDEALRRDAADYDRMRAGSFLGPIRLRVNKAGTYETYRQERLRGGAAEAQLKTVHLIADAEALPAGLAGD